LIITIADFARSHAVNTIVNMATRSNVNDPPTVDALKRSRRPLRAQLVKRINEGDAELARTEPDATVIQVKLDMMQKCYDPVEALDIDILVLRKNRTQR